MNRRLLILFLYVSIVTSGFSQALKFPEDENAFIQALNERFTAVFGKKKGKLVSEEMNSFWSAPGTSSKLKKQVIETCNLMTAKRARPNPDLYTYMQTAIAFSSSEYKSNFDIWQTVILDMLKKSRSPLRNVMKQIRLTKDLVEKNIIFSTPSIKWAIKNGSFRYKNINGKLIIEVDNADLTGYAKSDSIVILDTRGYADTKEQKWTGTKGKITWERSGYAPDKVYASFKKYNIDLNKSYFQIDTVTFYNSFYFDKPLKGSLKHKIMIIHDPSKSTYPKFNSFEQRYKIKQIHRNIDYEGGFSQYGAKFLGSGTPQNPAKLSIYKNGNLFITAKSLYFALRKDHILSNNTEISMNLDSGMIYHPGLMFKYIVEDSEILLIRNGEGISQSPFFDTYHNISIDVEQISWKMNETWMNFTMVRGAAENFAFFESLSYFREDFYNQLQGMDAIHPLQGLKNCSNYFGGNPFTAKDYAEFMHLPEPQVRQQLMALSFYGFIGYNINTDEVVIKQHLFDYLLFRLGKKDYDVIRFNSVTPGKTPNAQLDLKSYELNLNGVKNISISDNKNVILFPKNDKIILKQNRNFQFDGKVSAGMVTLFGNDFLFSYEDFSIDMNNIDSLNMQVETGESDYFGKPVLHDVINNIANMSGKLTIDAPENKSGIKQYNQYPILESTKHAIVYFNKDLIQGGAYDREKFYFTLEPFKMDSLNNLKKENFDFVGTFTSNIFPDFRERLKIKDDYSLGFNLETPTEGYNIFGEKSHFTGSLELNRKGLTGSGTLKYLTSTSKAEDLVFTPKRVTGTASEFTVKKQTEGTAYPDAEAKYVKIDYYPLKEELYAQSQEDFFKMFTQEAQLNGKLRITPFGADGKGLLYMLRGSLGAPSLTFSDHSVLADSSSFKLVGEDEEAIRFSTTNLISSNVDFKTREGVFTSMGEGDPVSFGDNKYMAIITKFSWDMDINKIYMGAHGSKGNLFISLNRKQDSLQFYVPIAEYDMEKTLIVCEEVKYINVADAKLVLKNGIVNLRANAAMDPLDSVVIEIGDTATFTHRIYDAKINITGRYSYNGTGYYDFINEENNTNKIFFHSIEANRHDRITLAEGQIEDTNLFTFNSHFGYKGKVLFNAKEQFLTFDGGVQILHNCGLKGPKSYLKFKAAIDPLKVYIPVAEEAENLEHNRVYNDFFISKDSSHVYSSFIEDREFYSDIPIITGGGYLTYNETEQSFDMASMGKLMNPDSIGKILRFSEKDCSVTASGVLNLGIPLGQVVTKASGEITDKRNKNEISLSAMLGIDFYLDEATIDLLYSSFINSRAALSKISSDVFTERLAQWTGIEDAEKINKKRTIMGAMENIPVNLKNTFTFSNIDLKWNSKKHCYFADGKADLAFIKQFVINQEVKVKLEITRKRSGNMLEMYIEADNDMWFFFSYKNGEMYTISANGEYNTFINKLDQSKRKLKSVGGNSYIYMISPNDKKAKFLREFGVRTPRNNNPLDRNEF
jgi:hypothetical protein